VAVTDDRRIGANTSEMIIRSFVCRKRFEGSVQTNLEVLYKHCACVGGRMSMFGTRCSWQPGTPSVGIAHLCPVSTGNKLRVESKGQLELAARQMGGDETMFILSLTWL